jgi:hypothetical protein
MYKKYARMARNQGDFWWILNDVSTSGLISQAAGIISTSIQTVSGGALRLSFIIST